MYALYFLGEVDIRNRNIHTISSRYYPNIALAYHIRHCGKIYYVAYYVVATNDQNSILTYYIVGFEDVVYYSEVYTHEIVCSIV
jgi:hypothetical protein